MRDYECDQNDHDQGSSATSSIVRGVAVEISVYFACELNLWTLVQELGGHRSSLWNIHPQDLLSLKINLVTQLQLDDYTII